MTSTCITTRLSTIRQTTIVTQRRQRHDLFYNNKYNNHYIIQNNNFKYSNQHHPRAAVMTTVSKGFSTQDNLKMNGIFILGTAFVVAALAEDVVHADSAMAPAVSPAIHVPRGDAALAYSRNKNKLEEKVNKVTPASTNQTKSIQMNKVTNSSPTSSPKGSNNNSIQMKPNPRKYNVSIRALRGGRLYMEDEYYVSEDGHFAGVFDGHGGNGVSSYLKDNLYNTICTTLCNGTCTTPEQKKYWEDGIDDDDDDDDLNDNEASVLLYSKAIQRSISDIDNQVLSKVELENQGSTAVAIYVHEDSNTNQRTILSANVGDSRAILSRRKKAIDLTRDHKPNEEKERNRILAMGETIEWDPFSHVYRVRNLSLSRAIGDKFAKPAISGEAEMKIFPLWEDEDEFIVLASDGLWDVMNSQDAVNFVHRRLDAPYRPRKKVHDETAASPVVVDLQKVYEERKRLMSRYLAHEALLRGSADNICVVIVWLKDSKL